MQDVEIVITDTWKIMWYFKETSDHNVGQQGANSPSVGLQGPECDP